MSTFEFDDGIGGRLRGTLHAPGATPGDVLTVGATHGTVSPAPGGGSQPSGIEQIVATALPLTIGASSTAFVPWSNAQGTPLFDYSTPTQPKVLATGVYSLSVVVNGQPYADTSVSLFTPDENTGVSVPASPSHNVTVDYVLAVVTWVVALTAGVGFKVEVDNDESVLSCDYYCSALAQKIA